MSAFLAFTAVGAIGLVGGALATAGVTAFGIVPVLMPITQPIS